METVDLMETVAGASKAMQEAGLRREAHKLVWSIMHRSSRRTCVSETLSQTGAGITVAAVAGEQTRICSPLSTASTGRLRQRLAG